jgi:diguanylate cyclase (GGDEF)-like protein/PAS domain S-box-containing protein
MRCATLCLILGAWATLAGAAVPAKLTVVTDDNYPPYLFRSADGSLQGITKEKWDLWSARTGVPVDLQGMAWAKAQELTLAGGADVIESIALTESRRALYEFSPAYATVNARVFFHQSVGGIHDVASMRGFTIGSKEGSACDKWLADKGDTHVRDYPSSEAVVMAAIAGDVRLFCLDAPTARYFLVKLGKANEFRETEPLYSASLHWAVGHGRTELRDYIQAGFERIGAEPIEAINARWLGNPLRSPLDPRFVAYFVAAIGVVVAGAALLVLWNRTLRGRVASRTAELNGAMRQIEKQAENVRDLYDNAPCGYHSLDMQGVYVEVNDTELRWLGMARDELVGKRRFSDFLTDDGRDDFRRHFARFLEIGEVRDIEYDLVRSDGSIMRILLSATLRCDADGRPATSNATLYDITERTEAQERLAHVSHHDGLTGLPNRALLRDRLQQAIGQAHREGTLLAVLFIDLDRFKTINDSLGQAAGDELLLAAASRLAESVRDGDTLSRVGGDGFVVVATGIESAGHASAIAAGILERLAQSVKIAGQEVHVTSSIGIALYPADGSAPDLLVRHAETAMYHAKEAGRAGYQFYAAHMNVAARERLSLENALRRGLENQEFELVYQPIFDLATRTIVGLEALLRWHPPGRAVIAPADFIAVAEESRLIVPIGEWVLREALARARRWQGLNKGIKLAVNVSGSQLARGDFFDRLRAIVGETGADPRRTEIEVTETVIIGSTGTARESLDRIAALGIGVAIDDFGTGFAGLGYLRRLPVSKLKIDQSFVRNLTRNRGDAAIVSAVIAMARGLGVTVVAEGVETEEQFVELKRLGCDCAQGYLLSRPLAVDRVETLFATSAKATVAAD